MRENHLQSSILRWVTLGYRVSSARCPSCPQERTSARRRRRSEKCQLRTLASYPRRTERIGSERSFLAFLHGVQSQVWCALTFQLTEKASGPVLNLVVREHLEQCLVPLAPLDQRHCECSPDRHGNAVGIVRIDQQRRP